MELEHNHCATVVREDVTIINKTAVLLTELTA